MSKLIRNYIEKERELARLKRELEMLQSNPAMKHEMEFKKELEELMTKFSMNARDIIDLLGYGREIATNEQKQTTTRKPRPVKTYKNPHTNEIVKTRGANHKQIRDWRSTYNENIEDWVISID